MDNFCKIRRRGFTLVELLIAMAAGTVIMAAVYSAMNLALRFSANTDRKVITQQDTRAVLDLMAMEIRMASYNPTVSLTTWSGNVLGNCSASNISLTQAFKGIQVANANQIAIAMDLDGSKTIGNFANEYIVYSYDGADTLNRSVSCVGADILGGSAPFTNVRNAAVRPDPIPLFQYFDKNDVEITKTVNNNPSLVNGIPAIRRIQITIVTDTLANDTTQSGIPRPRRMIYSTSVIVRNHALSP
jgi:prepilin-type N-terminal cleavage/methylation domain-containing protein